MKRLRLFFVPLLFLNLSLATEVHATNVVTDVELKSPLFGKNFINLELLGILKDTCTSVDDVRYEPGPAIFSQSVINVYMQITKEEEICASSTVPYRHEVFLGDLGDGVYAVNVYENDELAFTKEVSVPYDIRSNSLDFEFDRSVGMEGNRYGWKNSSTKKGYSDDS